MNVTVSSVEDFCGVLRRAAGSRCVSAVWLQMPQAGDQGAACAVAQLHWLGMGTVQLERPAGDVEALHADLRRIETVAGELGLLCIAGRFRPLAA